MLQKTQKSITGSNSSMTKQYDCVMVDESIFGFQLGEKCSTGDTEKVITLQLDKQAVDFKIVMLNHTIV